MAEANDASIRSGKALGGIARAKALTPEQRSEISRQAAQKRWADIQGQRVFTATHAGDLKLGGEVIPCAVLEDGTRVVSERGLIKSFGGKRGGYYWRWKKANPDGAYLPPVLVAKNLKPFVDNVFGMAPMAPILYRWKGKVAHGLKAEIYPKICEVFLKARDANVIRQRHQKDMAVAADILMRGLAHVGIIALVDEATGYQDVRDRLALQAILDEYIGKELAKWAKRFPDEFYEQMFRLKGWKYNPSSSKRPMLMARMTIDVVFDRIGPGLTKELQQRREEINKSTGKRGRLHQVLTPDVGHPALQHHLSGITFLAKAFPDADWDGFHHSLDRIAPSYNRALLLPFPEDAAPRTGDLSA